MSDTLPTVEVVRAALAPFNTKQLERLTELSGVPFMTLYNIKRGHTENPGLDTVRKFLPHVKAALIESAPA